MKIRLHNAQFELIEIDHPDLEKHLSSGCTPAIPEYHVIEENAVHGRKVCVCKTTDSSVAYEALGFYLKKAYLEANLDMDESAPILSDFEALETYVHDELFTPYHVIEVY